MPRRNKVVVLLTMPIAVFIWFIGSTLLSFGSKQKSETPKVSKRNGLSVFVLPQEQEILA
jgi:hypothetical protein